jgi:hypothetical protein
LTETAACLRLGPRGPIGVVCAVCHGTCHYAMPNELPILPAAVRRRE